MFHSPAKIFIINCNLAVALFSDNDLGQLATAYHFYEFKIHTDVKRFFQEKIVNFKRILSLSSTHRTTKKHIFHGIIYTNFSF